MNIKQIENEYKPFCLPKKEEDKLVLIAKSHDARNKSACNKLIEANQYWAALCAYNYQFSQLDFMDLFVSALEGLWKSLFSYDVNNVVPLATYAKKAMTQCILDSINTVGYAHGKLPAATQRDMNRLNKVSENLRNELQYEPDIEELAAAMKVNADYVSSLQSLKQRYVSLDTDKNPVEPEVEDDNLYEFTDGEPTSTPNCSALKHLLPPLDYDVFVRSRGLDGFKPMTHEEILYDINRIRAAEGKKLKTLEDVYIHYNRAVLLDRCFD